MAAAIIVNADDLGRTVGINEGIFEAHRRGVVSSATLMVAPAAAQHAVENLVRYPDLGVGLHVTLTGGGAPTLGSRRVPSLVGSDGQLPRGPELLDELDPDQLLAEVRNQLALFVELAGRMPTHLDSHHHTHRYPGVLAAVAAVAREHALPVRCASEWVGRRLRAQGVRTTESFDQSFFGLEATLLRLLEIFHGVAVSGLGTVEVMCHPGYSDDALRASSSYADERERELVILTAPEARSAIAELGLRLVHFGSGWAPQRDLTAPA